MKLARKSTEVGTVGTMTKNSGFSLLFRLIKNKTNYLWKVEIWQTMFTASYNKITRMRSQDEIVVPKCREWKYLLSYLRRMIWLMKMWHKLKEDCGNGGVLRQLCYTWTLNKVKHKLYATAARSEMLYGSDCE